jgi:hypothetical protein
LGKVVETRLDPVDARVGAVSPSLPSFFFLFNNLKKKRKERGRGGLRSGKRGSWKNRVSPWNFAGWSWIPSPRQSRT